jgi:integrase
MQTYGQRSIKYLEDREVRKLISKSANPLLLEFVYYLGLRRGEVSLIRRSDVTEHGVVVTVLKSGRKGGERERYLMPLEGDLRRRILELKLSHQHEYLFPGYKGKGLTGDAIENIWRKVCPDHGPHVLRHSRAMAMSQAGYSLEECQAWLRHTSINSTQVYYHITASRLKDIAKAMAK